MSDEEHTVEVDLSDEDEEWVQYAQLREESRSDVEIDEESLEAEARAKLEQAVYRHLESLDNDVLDVSKRLELCDHHLLDNLAGLVVQEAQDVDATRERIRDLLRDNEGVSPFDLPRLTREVTAEYLVEEEVGKARIRNLADCLLEPKRSTHDPTQFVTDASRTERN